MSTTDHRSLARLPLSIFDGIQLLQDEQIIDSDELRREFVSKLKTTSSSANNKRSTRNNENNYHQESVIHPNNNSNNNNDTTTVAATITTVGGLLRISPITLMRILDPLLTLNECIELQRRICIYCSPKSITAYDIYINNKGYIRTGLNVLDHYLRGGFAIGTITEIVGMAATGKTQLALQMSVLCGQNNFGTIFIDTERKVSIQRLEEIARTNMKSSNDITTFLSNVKIHTPNNIDELKYVLKSLEEDIVTSVVPIKLLIIDSIAAPARREFGSPIEQAQTVMQIAQTVKRLADQFNLCIIMINQVGSTNNNIEQQSTATTGSRIDNPSSTTNTTLSTKAALGTAWHHCVSTRIQLEHVNPPHGIRYVSVQKCNRVGPSEKFPFHITNRGIESVITK